MTSEESQSHLRLYIKEVLRRVKGILLKTYRG
jgi:hypothetical protein